MFLERLIAARRGGLPLQMPDLLVDLVAHVLQALEIFARVGDTRLGLLATLLVREMPAASSRNARMSSALASMTREIMPCSMIA